jgi:hypothetical protein
VLICGAGEGCRRSLDRSCEKWSSITQSQGGEEYPTYIKRRKANWIGHTLRRNCLLKHVIVGKLEGRIEMTGRRGRRRKQLLDDLKEKRRYWKLKEEALYRTLWTTRFGRGYGPVVRQTTEWMNEWMNAYMYANETCKQGWIQSFFYKFIEIIAKRNCV